MITAWVWVLVWAMGSPGAFTVAGLASRDACNDLGRRMQADYAMNAVRYDCFPYLTQLR